MDKDDKDNSVYDIPGMKEFIRAELQRGTVNLADSAEKHGFHPLAGIFYTVAGVIEGNLDENFANLCNDYIEEFRKAHKEFNDKVDPKKFN